MTTIMRRGALWASCLVLALTAFLPLTAGAVTTSATPDCRQDLILSGLWAGVNTALGTNYGCTTSQGTWQDGQSWAASQQDTQTSGAYAALGDSVAAGLGMMPAAGTDPACGVSTEAYPSYVASALGVPYRNFACSGATAGDLFTEQHLPDTSRDIEPQLNTAFANGRPSLITITAGANDIYWPYYVHHCYVGECGTATDNAIVSGLFSILRLKLEYALSRINSLSNNQPPMVILTGYYQPFSAACAQQGDITADEIAWLNHQTDTLNQILMQTASSYSFVRFAPVDFSGHELCAADPWIQGADSSAPFHPTASGQQAIAWAVLDANQ